MKLLEPLKQRIEALERSQKRMREHVRVLILGNQKLVRQIECSNIVPEWSVPDEILAEYAETK